jgi:hypothetical protein
MMHNYRLRFRTKEAATRWLAEAMKMNERSTRVLKSAGPECLPALLARLTARAQRSSLGFLRRWLFALGLTDFAPMSREDEAEARRGQALTAILLLDKRASALIPQLSVLAAQDKDDAVTRAASYALWEIAPDEFRRIRSPQFRRVPTPTPGVAEPRSSPGGP